MAFDKQQLVLDCLNISSGTIATLTGYKSYENIEKVQANLVVWVMEQDALFESWMKAWESFKNKA